MDMSIADLSKDIGASRKSEEVPGGELDSRKSGIVSEPENAMDGENDYL